MLTMSSSARVNKGIGDPKVTRPASVSMRVNGVVPSPWLVCSSQMSLDMITLPSEWAMMASGLSCWGGAEWHEVIVQPLVNLAIHIRVIPRHPLIGNRVRKEVDKELANGAPI